MTLTLTVLTPLLAFAGALLGVVLNRRGARELGADQVDALQNLDQLDACERAMVKAALTSMVSSRGEGEEG